MSDPERWLAELDARNADNVTRTAAYLELYTFTLQHPPELPWLLMAHLVSRNAGYLMSDLRRSLDDPRTGALPGYPELATNLFELLERANWLIFWDAWHHVLSWRLRGREGLQPGRTTEWVREAWPRLDDTHDERRLVLDLVVNEQNLIENRAVHHPRFAGARQLLSGIEGAGRDKPVHLPHPDATAEIRVGEFASLRHRIEAGRRLYDEVLADRELRRGLHGWALAHPHTGSRAVYGGRPGPTVPEAWPREAVRAAWPGVHAPPEPDPAWP